MFLIRIHASERLWSAVTFRSFQTGASARRLSPRPTVVSDHPPICFFLQTRLPQRNVISSIFHRYLSISKICNWLKIRIFQFEVFIGFVFYYIWANFHFLDLWVFYWRITSRRCDIRGDACFRSRCRCVDRGPLILGPGPCLQYPEAPSIIQATLILRLLPPSILKC